MSSPKPHIDARKLGGPGPETNPAAPSPPNTATKILDEYNQAPYGEKSAVLRREGLYQSQLREWSGTRGSKRPAKVKSENIKGRNNTDAADRKEIDRLT